MTYSSLPISRPVNDFRAWNEAFTNSQIHECRKHWLYDRLDGRSVKGIECTLTRWEYGYNQPTHAEVQDAVYLADDAHEWQLFRVSLKGLTTALKLFMLEQWYLERFSTYKNSGSAWDTRKELIRVHNYIGALRRGGQLNADLTICK